MSNVVDLNAFAAKRAAQSARAHRLAENGLVDCPTCHGAQWIDDAPCGTCGGEGAIPDPVDITEHQHRHDERHAPSDRDEHCTYHGKP